MLFPAQELMMEQARSSREEEDKQEEGLRDASVLSDRTSGRPWRDIPRNATLTEAQTLTFFSEFKHARELTDMEVIERCNFLMRHAPPKSYLSLKIKGNFVHLIKRLEKVCLSLAVEPRPMLSPTSICRSTCGNTASVAMTVCNQAVSSGRRAKRSRPPGETPSPKT
jgi:hypothetical protein